MALFPAYACLSEENKNIVEESVPIDTETYPDEATECRLLISDDSSEDEKSNDEQYQSTKAVCIPEVNSANNNFYVDCKVDYGNLRVSTLYYPGRPQYEYSVGDKIKGERGQRKDKRKQRYFSKHILDEPDEPAVAERTQAYHLLIAKTPNDILLWERFIDFQEACAGAEAALRTCEEAVARLPRAERLRERFLAVLRRALPPHRYLERLRDILAGEKCMETRTSLWERLLEALAAAPDCDAARVSAAESAALRDVGGAAGGPARLLHAAGAALRAAGHWERLVLLLDLLVAMNYAPAALVPPDPQLQARAERRLADAEDKALGSGLPLSAVWVRVERARATAHWWPARGAVESADPQRTPLPHDVAELLLPLAGAELARVSPRLLALAQVPALPGSQWVRRVVGGMEGGEGAAEVLLPLLDAARRLPHAHPAAAVADAELARRVLALLLDPPHYFTDDTGYLTWVNSLWDACIAQSSGAVAVGLLCWRLRWLRALLALAPRDEAGRREAARVRCEARALLRSAAAASSPLPFGEFARVEREAAGVARATHVAMQALRAALADATCPPSHAIYIARIVCEVSWEGSAQETGVGMRALVCAVLRRTLVTESDSPSTHDVRDALEECEMQCLASEEALAGEEAGGEKSERGEGGEGADALLPGAGEWARARALLAPPSRREELLRRARGAAALALAEARPAAARYWEESVEALCSARGGGVRAAQWARVFSPLFPGNAYLALASAGAPLWALWAREDSAGAAGVAGAAGDVGGGETAALAALLPSLLRALRSDFAPAEAEACARVARRLSRSRRGAVLWTARLEAEARAPAPRLPHALYAALDAAPGHKWLYVRGAAWCGGEAPALADALLERAMRLHALPDELALATTTVTTNVTATTEPCQ